MQFNEQEFPLLDMSSDIWGAIVESSGDNFEQEVMFVLVVDARDVEKGKEISNLSLSFYTIQNMFEYVIVWSDKKDYIVKCSLTSMIGYVEHQSWPK